MKTEDTPEYKILLADAETLQSRYGVLAEITMDLIKDGDKAKAVARLRELGGRFASL